MILAAFDPRTTLVIPEPLLTGWPPNFAPGSGRSKDGKRLYKMKMLLSDAPSLDVAMRLIKRLQANQHGNGTMPKQVFFHCVFAEFLFDEKEAKIGYMRNPYLVERLFEVFDEDGTDVINLYHFCIGLLLCSAGQPSRKLLMIFAVSDKDKSNILIRSELGNLFRSFVAVSVDIIRSMGQDDPDAKPPGSGMATLVKKGMNSLIGKGVMKIMTYRYLKKMDTDKSGDVDMEEFVAYSRKQGTTFRKVLSYLEKHLPQSNYYGYIYATRPGTSVEEKYYFELNVHSKALKYYKSKESRLNKEECLDFLLLDKCVADDHADEDKFIFKTADSDYWTFRFTDPEEQDDWRSLLEVWERVTVTNFHSYLTMKKPTLVTSWKKRYVYLDGDSQGLQYGERMEDEEILGGIEDVEKVVADDSTTVDPLTGAPAFGFRVTGIKYKSTMKDEVEVRSKKNRKTYVFLASSAALRDEWIGNLREICGDDSEEAEILE